MSWSIDSKRLTAELATLAAISDAPAPAVTRVVFSETDLRARQYLKALFADAGLEIREDAVGNTYARWHGTDPGLPAVATGSHVDAIPNAGQYDGTVGVLGALEAIRALRAGGHSPRLSIELILFTAEEPTRFGVGCLGSRLMAGALGSSAGERLRDRDGRTLDEARAQAGFSGSLDSVLRKPGDYAAFVELHIEQGPLLERQNLPIGIVTAIAAPASLRMTIEGEGGHAGAVLMPQRHDAFLAAAEVALAAERAARATGAIDTVATTGVCEVFPGAINSIPSRVRIELDVRDTDVARRDQVLASIAAGVEETQARRGVRIATEIINADLPARCDPGVVAALEAAAYGAGLPFQKMVSRAYHDSLFVSRFAPASMLFIPCRGGVSHRPDEFSSPEAIAAGASVLAEFLGRASA